MPTFQFDWFTSKRGDQLSAGDVVRATGTAGTMSFGVITEPNGKGGMALSLMPLEGEDAFHFRLEISRRKMGRASLPF